MKKTEKIRQGDVLLVPVNKSMEKAKVVKNHYDVEIGEHRNHSHNIDGADTLVLEEDGIKYFSVETDTKLKHPEHKELDIIGNQAYKVIVKNEYDPFAKEIVKVKD